MMRISFPIVWIGGLLAVPFSCGPSIPLSTELEGDIFVVTQTDSDPKLSGLLGIAPTPKNFPNHTEADVEAMFAQTSQLVDAAVFIYQWSDPNLLWIAEEVIERSGQAGLIPILGLSPTTLDQNRSQIDAPIPSNWLGAVLSFVLDPSFQQPWIRDEFVATAEQLASLKPPYLCLATEINLLELQKKQEARYFVQAYKEAYQAVKKISPETRVFVSFQYEFIRVLDNLEPDQIEKHAQLLDVFRPELDLLAITTYPSVFYGSPQQMPVNYYRHLQNYRQNDEEVLVMEIGWPSQGSGSQQEQKDFIARLPLWLSSISPSVTAWSLLHDVEISQFDVNLSTTGLLTGDGDEKPAMQVFDSLK